MLSRCTKQTVLYVAALTSRAWNGGNRPSRRIDARASRANAPM